MPDQVADKPRQEFVPGETAIAEQLQNLRTEMAGDVPQASDDDDDPIARAKQLVADNYNEFRNPKRTPALTPELITVLWFNGSRSNWKAVCESSIVHGIRYEVSCNMRKKQAFINVYRKSNNVEVNW